MERFVYRFNEFELDPHERRLLAHNRPVALTPKVFDALLFLIRNAGRVVSKDELVASLWPRGFIHESNLTRNIWLLRKALSDTGDTPLYIETRPKHGYRFVAQVHTSDWHDPAFDRRHRSNANGVADRTVVRNVSPGEPAVERLAAASNTDPMPRVTATPDAWRKRAAVAALALIILIAVVFSLRQLLAPPLAGIPEHRSIALVEFRNLAPDANDAWLSSALSEMLGTELQASGDVSVLPDALVRGARVDLGAPSAGGYAESGIERLRKSLGTDYVLSGSYLVTNTGGTPRLRIDVALQNARTGVILGSITRNSPIENVTSLVAQLGAELRAQLGEPVAGSRQLAMIANAQPPNAIVAQRIGEALDALHRYDSVQARDGFLEAISLAPDYAPSYVYLAQSLERMGYKEKARSAIERAAALSDGLSQDQRLQIDAQLAMTKYDWPAAVAAYRQLTVARPGDPEPLLQMIDSATAGLKLDEADAGVAELRKLSAANDDPRIELAAAAVAAAREDQPLRLAHAQSALRQAEAHGAVGLIANANFQIGGAMRNLDRLQESETALRQAIASFQRIADVGGEARARNFLASVLMLNGKLGNAIEEYHRAQQINEKSMNLAGEALDSMWMSVAQFWRGDRNGAMISAARGLQLSHEVEDVDGQAWSRAALFTYDLDDVAGEQATADYFAALSDDKAAQSPSTHVWLLSERGQQLSENGQIDAANQVCMQAENECTQTPALPPCLQVHVKCGTATAISGNLDAASAELAQTAEVSKAHGVAVTFGEAEVMLGRMAISKGDWQLARRLLQDASDSYGSGEFLGGRANAQALLALTFAKLGDVAQRDQAESSARELLTRVNTLEQVFIAHIALTRLKGELGQRVVAESELDQLAEDAEKRNWVSWALEAKLAKFELLTEMQDPEAKTLAPQIKDEATRYELDWILQRLRRP